MDQETLDQLKALFDRSQSGTWSDTDHKRYLNRVEDAGISIELGNDYAYQERGIWKADEYLDDWYVEKKFNDNKIDYGSIGYDSAVGQIVIEPARQDFYNQYHDTLPTKVKERDRGFVSIRLDEDGESDRTYGTYRIDIVAVNPAGNESIVHTEEKEIRVIYDRDDEEWRTFGSQGSEDLQDLKDDADQWFSRNKDDIIDYSKAYNNNASRLIDIADDKSKEGENINSAYDTTVKQANRSKKGEYVARRGTLRAIDNVPDSIKNNIEAQYRSFYADQVVEPYDTSITAKPPTGDFVAEYYLNTYSDVANAYQREVDNDNLDIIGTYPTREIWAEGHYTHNGRYERRRANADEDTTIADAYTLKAPTDQEVQQIRDRQLGITATPEEPIIGRLKKDQSVNTLWEKVKEGTEESYNERAEENGFNYESFQDFVIAFLTSNDEDDIKLRDDLVTKGTLEEGEETITDIEDALERAAGDEAREQVKDFGALAENVLADTLAEIEEAKAMEAQFDMYSGFDSFGEVMNPGAGLTESILGDSGIGGYLGFMGGPEYGENLEDSINNMFGLGSITERNWQEWFDQTLAEKYAREYDDLFKDLEVRRNILEAAAPNERDYIDYVNAHEDLNEKYFQYVKATPEEDRETKAEWGKRHYEEFGDTDTGRDLSMLNKQIYDPETGEFTKDFLEVSFFENTKDVEDYLTANGETELLNQLKADNFDSFALESELESVVNAIENVDSEEYDIILNSIIGEERVEAQFARDFINDYLKPRFDQSKSMAEFRDYINVDPDVQSPFQTQNIIDALKATAQMRADAYMEEINGAIDQNFNADFYYDPTEGYTTGTEQAIDIRSNFQKDIVERDYQNALKGEVDPDTGIDWVAEMYRYGVPVTYTKDTQTGYYQDIESIDRAQFARMHYDVKGSKGVVDPSDPDKTIVFRPALNVADPDRIKRYIYYEVMPLLQEEAVDIGSVFGQFVTPEEFADDILSTYNIENQEELSELLKEYGLDDVGDMGELRDQLIEVISTNDAIAIREGIKYMNEQGLRPDQQNLGVQYIEREEDYKPDIQADTELFKIFQSAGYQGTQEQFYEEFLPDEDPSELAFLEDAMTGLSFDVGDFSDPFSMMVSMDRYFPDEEKESLSYQFGGQDEDAITQRYSDVYTQEAAFNTDASYNSYYDTLYEGEYGSSGTPKSESGESFLNEFTRGFDFGKKYKTNAMIY